MRATLIIVFILLLLTGCELGFTDTPQSFVAPDGPVAGMQGDLFLLSVWLMVGILVVVSVLLAYALWRYRDRGQKEIPFQNPGDLRFEVVWTLIPTLLVIFLAVPSVRIAYDVAGLPRGVDDALEVKVTGYQYWWKFEYPQLGIVTANELHVPVDRHIDFTLVSTDVIHSFWVPRLAGKVDANPGKQTHFWWLVDRPGVYYGQCAEYCGTSHANMRMRVIAQAPEEFDAWVADMRAAQATTPAAALADTPAMDNGSGTALIARGRELFMANACGACHALGDAAATGDVGPDLNNFGKRHTLAAGVYENTLDNLKEWIRNPDAMKPGVIMPPFPLSDDDLDTLARYLLSQK